MANTNSSLKFEKKIMKEIRMGPPLILGALLLGTGEKNEEVSPENRREVLKRFVKVGALGLGTLFALKTLTGCGSDSSSGSGGTAACECQSVGNCSCNKVCTCNTIRS